MPVVMAVALELYAADAGSKPYLAFVACVRLLKIWCGLRYDDHVGIAPSSMVVE